jgi:ubiquinone/menaquinone biosynthesis C-methylase UbiE
LPEGSALFDDYAEQYDTWYDTPKGRAILDIEVACLRPLMELFRRPYLEVGVGTGRFAHALGIERGIDPSASALEAAGNRGIAVTTGVAEDIPIDDSTFGGVLTAFTLCFVTDPGRALAEIRRVLVQRGGLVLGLLPKGTPWANLYARRGAEGHPLYRSAHFYSVAEVEALLEGAGFRVVARRSTLFQPPGQPEYGPEEAVEGFADMAGFAGVAAVRAAG